MKDVGYYEVPTFADEIEETPSPDEKSSVLSRKWTARVLFLCTIPLCAGIIAISTRDAPNSKELSDLELRIKNKYELPVFESIVQWNEETENAGKQAGKGYPAIAEGDIVEPHVRTRFMLAGPTGEIENGWNDLKAQWTIMKVHPIDSNEIELVSTATTDTTYLDLTISFLGHIRVEIQIEFMGTKTKLRRDFKVRYVRRNIRTISDKGRNRFFAAMHSVMAHSQHEGEALYGTDFKAIDYFVKIHLNNAGGKKGDKIHDGLGFMTQHAALTDAFERSLRSVDNSVSVPYWVYTEDAYNVIKYHNSDPKMLWQQDVWQSSWFGNATAGNNRYHTIETGRFAYQRIGIDSTNEVHNPYGYLRSPWNMNKDPFVARVHHLDGVSMSVDNWPQCETFYEQNFGPRTNFSYYDWAWQISYAPHGPVHSMIGGYYHTGNLFEKFAKILPDAAIGAFAESMINFPKELYRSISIPGFDFPHYCSSDTPQDLCHMICPKQWMTKGVMTNELEGILSAYDWGAKLIEAENEDRYKEFVKILCLTPFSAGEQLESGSPVDSSFHSIHPELERLLIYKRILQPFVHAEWSNPHGKTTYCMYEDFGHCEGHHAYDVTHFDIMVQDDTTGDFTVSWLTNAEIFQMMNPADLKMQYVYDSFEWEHCNEDHVYFPHLGWASSSK